MSNSGLLDITVQLFAADLIYFHVFFCELQFDTTLLSSQSEPLRIVTLKLGLILTLLSVTVQNGLVT